MSKGKFSSGVVSRILYIIFSILASFAIWFFIAINENPDQTTDFRGIDVVYSGIEQLEDNNLIVTGIDTQKISLSLKGKRLTIAKLSSSDIIATVDLSSITSPGTHLLEPTVSFNQPVKRNDIIIDNASTRYVTVTVKRLATKPIDVRGTFVGNVEDGYIGGALEITPGTIEIHGPEDELSKVDHAVVVLKRENISKTITDNLAVTLVDENEQPVSSDTIKIETDTVAVTKVVSLLKDVALTVNVNYGSGATSENTIVEIDPPSISLSGDAEELEGINNIVLGTIDATMFQSSHTEEFVVKIPNETVNRTGITSANVTVRVVGLETKKLSVSNIEITDVSDGYKAELITQALDVTLRGTESELLKITADNVRIIASLEELDEAEGVFDVFAKVSVDGLPNGGAIGTYKVNVTVSKS